MDKLKKDFSVRIYECDRDGSLHFGKIFNLFQEVADENANQIGVGYDYCLAHNIGWVGAGYVVKIDRMPACEEKFTLYTWPSDKTAVSAIRDFKAVSEKGDTLFYATSQWALVNLETKRLVRMEENLPPYEPIRERVIDSTFPAIPLPERVDHSLTYPVRFDEIDINKHVNNAVYPLWASEAVPSDFRSSHTVKGLSVAFKRPAVFGTTIAAETQIDETTTRTAIKSADDGTVFARVQIDWA